MGLSMPQRMRVALWISPAILVVIAFFALIPWLSEAGDAVVLAVTAAAAISVMAWSLLVAVRAQKHLDEVQRARTQFAWQWGAAAGGVGVVILLLLPPFQSFVADLAIGLEGLGGEPAPETDREALVLAFTLGFMTLLFLQLVGTAVVSAVWGWWVGRE